MKNSCLLIPAVALAVGGLSWSCVDDNYDLSDIDKTIRVRVDDLVIPINIDEIELSSVIKLKDGGIVEIVDGQYVVRKHGDIDSDDISIDPVIIDAPEIESTDTPIHSRSSEGMDVSSVFDVASDPSHFSFVSESVSTCIVDLETVDGELTFDIDMAFSPVLPGKTELEGIVLQFPKGLVTNDSKYNISTGEYKAGNIDIVNGKASIHIVCSGFDFSYYPGAFNPDTHIVKFEGDVYVKDGLMKYYGESTEETVNLHVDFTISDFRAEAFSGIINYQVTSVDIPDVDLDDLPDLLSQKGTDISLKNPVIYLNVFNPMYRSKLYAKTGFDITAWRGSTASHTFSLDEEMEIGCNTPDGVSNYYLSPYALDADKISPEFPDAKHEKFSSLGKILSGDGLPQRLSIDLVDPRIPDQRVAHFKLGDSYGKVRGHYEFVAPLQFEGDSKIVYSDKIDGWNDEDFDKITITRLEVKLNISTNIPFGVDFTGYPIDADGRHIDNVYIEGAKVVANADNQEVTLRITGEVQHLDGVEFTALATSADNGNVLGPDMKISLKNIRPCISGYYDDEL